MPRRTPTPDHAQAFKGASIAHLAQTRSHDVQHPRAARVRPGTASRTQRHAAELRGRLSSCGHVDVAARLERVGEALSARVDPQIRVGYIGRLRPRSGQAGER